MLKLKDTVQAWLTSSLSDPLVKIMASNSQLTKTQLETLLIDILSENAAGKPLKYDEKASFRLIRAQISRGSFNRTLRQARQNVTKSMYTVILLGYLGIFETTALDPYLEIANKLRTYLEAHKIAIEDPQNLADRTKVIQLLRSQLETSLKQLAEPSNEQM